MWLIFITCEIIMQISMTIYPSSMFTEFCGITGKINVLVAGSEKWEIVNK